MKKKFNWVAIIAVVALICFGFMACESPAGLPDRQSEAARRVMEDNSNIAQEGTRVRGIADGSDFTSRLERRLEWMEGRFNEQDLARLLEERQNRQAPGRMECGFNGEDFDRLLEERQNRQAHGRMEGRFNEQDFNRLLEERQNREDHSRIERRFSEEDFERRLEERLNRQDIEQFRQSRPARNRGNLL